MRYQLLMGNDLKQRIRNLAGSQQRFADVLGISPEHLSRALAGKRAIPEIWIAVLELLELLPPKDWPERWRR